MKITMSVISRLLALLLIETPRLLLFPPTGCNFGNFFVEAPPC